MPKGSRAKLIQICYLFDQLGARKLSQVYRLLVPEEERLDVGRRLCLSTRRQGEDSGDLRTGLVGEAKGRADDF